MSIDLLILNLIFLNSTLSVLKLYFDDVKTISGLYFDGSKYHCEGVYTLHYDDRSETH